MLSTKQYLLEAIETASDDVLADLLGFFKHRQLPTANRQRQTSLAELQTICQEEKYSLEITEGRDRENPFVEEV